MGQRKYTFDANLELKDAGLVAATAACQVDAADKIIDVGAGRVDGMVVVDVSACEVASGDEIYTLHIQGSNSATFASGIVGLASMQFGDSVPLTGDTDVGAGHYEIPFTNEQNGTKYRYVRGYVVVAGSIATGINFTAFIAKQED